MKFVKKIRSSYCREIVPIVQIANQARSSEESIHSSPATAEATKPGHRPALTSIFHLDDLLLRNGFAVGISKRIEQQQHLSVSDPF
ncbi:hypothetical protein HUJ05_012348 [Dendroctonus ponderosae]|nr:hypothetical protein HUJ05_012348 [Dendroctonus ponderosae]